MLLQRSFSLFLTKEIKMKLEASKRLVAAAGSIEPDDVSVLVKRLEKFLGKATHDSEERHGMQITGWSRPNVYKVRLTYYSQDKSLKLGFILGSTFGSDRTLEVYGESMKDFVRDLKQQYVEEFKPILDQRKAQAALLTELQTFVSAASSNMRGAK